MSELAQKNIELLQHEMMAESVDLNSEKLTKPLKEYIYIPPEGLAVKNRWNYSLIALVVVNLSLLLGSYFYIAKIKAGISMQSEIKVVEPVKIGASKETEELEAEVQLMKKILVGLVESVSSLSKQSATDSSKESKLMDNSFPYPVRVQAISANLRKEPDRASESLGTVAKDTVLLATQQNNGWIRVTTVKGENAWIGRDLVSEQEN